MIFDTYWFISALAVFFPLFALIRAPKLRKYLLLVFCAIFHGHFAGAAGVAPIIVVGVLVYIAGLSGRRYAIYSAMAVSVMALLWYKYTYFFSLQVLGLFSQNLGIVASDWARAKLPAAPPLAISFFTFEFVHYLYDVAHGSPPIRKIIDFASFTIFFPSLVAGPIKRYEVFLPALDDGLKNANLSDATYGFTRLGIGYFKKIVIADNLTSYLEFAHPQFADFSRAGRWLFVVLVAFRILMDFSGYSDMAIGLARIMGVKIPENFNWPYLSTNIRVFWQRWHISLSSWIRDYVYIPIGGNRNGRARTAFNGIFAFGLCGLWHGPTWNFVFWGLYHGLGLSLSSNYQKFLGWPGRKVKSLFETIPLFSWITTMIFVMVGWLYFFYPFNEASKMAALLVMAKL